jgi:carboxylesterase type B
MQYFFFIFVFDSPTTSYRVDIFGFPGDPGLANRNLGFLDQRLGVEWVRDNIAGFGGDPKRMILFGQSAGSASVDSYSYSWYKDPIVSGFIMESGSAALGSSLNSDNGAAWYNATSSLGCGTNVTASHSEIISCMQTKDVDDILHAQGSNSFEPTADGITGFSDYPALAREGKIARLPILNGNNDFEAGLFIALDALVNSTHDLTYWENFSNTTFSCPAGARANVSYLHDMPIWRYRWFGNFPNTRLYTGSDSGAYHGSEISFIFDTLPRGEGIPSDTDQEISLRAYIQGAWAAFAKDPVKGLSMYKGGWPTYSPFGETLVRIGWNNQTGTNPALPSLYDSTCRTTFPVG